MELPLFKKAYLFVALLILVGGCATTAKEPVVSDPVKHVVFLWLKEPGNKEHRKKLVAATQTFRDIPGVVNVNAGEVIESEREIVDDSFDVGLTLTFATVDDMNAYLTHPLHKDALKSVLKPLVRKIVVYDYLE